jgi:HNH endonuclease
MPRVERLRRQVDLEPTPRECCCDGLGGWRRIVRVAAPVRREVYERDQGSCTFISDRGRRCGAQRFLELDHVQPWAPGGESTVDNLRLRCRAHNQHSAQAHVGVAHMRAAVNRARSQQHPSAEAVPASRRRGRSGRTRSAALGAGPRGNRGFKAPSVGPSSAGGSRRPEADAWAPRARSGASTRTRCGALRVGNPNTCSATLAAIPFRGAACGSPRLQRWCGKASKIS